VANWTCDVCQEPIEKPEDGWVEWITGNSEDGPCGHGLRLVHASHASPRGQMGCQYKPSRDFGPGEGLSDLDLVSFLGPDGLVRMLGFIADDRLPFAEGQDMIQRLHVPNYEEARPFIDDAVAEGVVGPRLAEGLYHQYQLREAIRWGQDRAS
jgi:hypothetical protein